MEKTEFTMKRRALSNLCTGLMGMVVLHLTGNWWITALMLVVFSLFFAVLFTKNGFTKKFKRLFTVIVIILIAMMCIFKFNARNVQTGDLDPKPPVVDTQVDENEDEDEDPTDDQEVVVDDDTSSSNNRKNWSYDKLEDKMEASFSNTDGLKPESNSKPNQYGGQGSTKVEGSTTVSAQGGSQDSKEELEAAKDAEKRGDEMEELNEGVIAGKQPVPENKEDTVVKDETTREDPKNNKVEEVTQTQPTTPPSQKEETPLEDQLKEDMTDDQLEDLFNNTPKEETEEQPKEDSKEEQPKEDQKEEITKPEDDGHNQSSAQQPEQPETNNKGDEADEDVKQDDNKHENETQPEVKPESDKDEVKDDSNDVTDKVPEQGEKEEDKVVEKPTETPVTITPLDGNQAYAGDSVQFKVTGEVGSVTGLDGLKYTLTGGYLTVETNPNEATVINPIIVGVDGVSTATTSVTINVINVQ